MRILLAALTAAFILIGTKVYLDANQPAIVERIPIQDEKAAGQFSIELIPLFDAGPDEFALDAANSSSVIVELRGKPVLNRTDAASSGEAIVIQEVKGLIAGVNELFIRATPSDGNVDVVRGMRVRVLRDQLVIAEQWLSSEPGSTVEGTVRLDLPSQDHKNDH